ncbi:hypothetical protein [Nonomuraea sp. NPDC049607]|uniref:hypothetical protein n=1 Tax=Nonomuraea sp. NPDC049607 TaxID=3154732 RepID=UPI00343A6319
MLARELRRTVPSVTAIDLDVPSIDKARGHPSVRGAATTGAQAARPDGGRAEGRGYGGAPRRRLVPRPGVARHFRQYALGRTGSAPAAQR